MDKYDIVTLTLENDYSEVIRLFKTEFLAREPTFLGLGSTPDDTIEYHIPIVMECLKSGISLGARYKPSGELVGLVLNTIITPTSKTCPSDPASYKAKNKFEANLQQMFAEMEAAVDVFDKYKVQKILDLEFLCTHKDHGGNGIAKALIKTSEFLGIRHKCQLAIVIASHVTTQTIFSKRGYETYNIYDFAKNNEIDLTKTGGTRGWHMMAKRL